MIAALTLAANPAGDAALPLITVPSVRRETIRLEPRHLRHTAAMGPALVVTRRRGTGSGRKKLSLKTVRTMLMLACDYGSAGR